MKEDLGRLQPHLRPQQGDGESPLMSHFKDQKGPGNSQCGQISTFRRAHMDHLLQDSLVLMSSSPLSPPAPGFIFTEWRPTAPARDTFLQAGPESHFGPYITLEYAS